MTPNNLTGGSPWLPDGHTCLPIPSYYSFDESWQQRRIIPIVYGLFHGSLLALVFMPIPMYHATWATLAGRYSWVRRWYAIPVDDFQFVHGFFGLLSIGGVAAGTTLWLVVMIPACMEEPVGWDETLLGPPPVPAACRAFRLSPSDPFRNTFVLRLMMAPLWATVMPLMLIAGAKWQDFVARAKEQPNIEGTMLQHALNPRLLWLVCIGMAHGSAFFLWAGLSLVSAVIGAMIGGGLGCWLALSSTVKLHWYEICQCSHKAVGYFTVLLAVVARFDVFWPCMITWGFLSLDKLAQTFMFIHPMLIELNDSRCIYKGKNQTEPSKLRLVLRVINADRAAFRSTQWIYLQLPAMHQSSASVVARSVSRAWHPLSLASYENGQIELLIDVHPPVGGMQTWSGSVFMHVKGLQQSHMAQQHARLADTGRGATYLPPLEAQVCGSFGSSFSRCFDTKHRWGSDGARAADGAKHDVVVLFGSGTGLPSALSALREFVRRRRDQRPTPRFVWFVWQASTPEDLQLCWDALHRIIAGAKGLCGASEHQRYRALGTSPPLDYEGHLLRYGGEEWNAASKTLEWLGVIINVAQWEGQQRPSVHDLHKQRLDNPLLHAHSSASHSCEPHAHAALAGAQDQLSLIHDWLTHETRLRPGRNSLAGVLDEVEALDTRMTSEDEGAWSVCVSMCGGSQKDLLRARLSMRGGSARGRRVEMELAGGYYQARTKGSN